VEGGGNAEDQGIVGWPRGGKERGKRGGKEGWGEGREEGAGGVETGRGERN